MIKTFLFWSALFIGMTCQILPSFAQEQPFLKTATGLRYKFIKSLPNAPKPSMGDVVELRMLYKNAKDSVLFDNRKEEALFVYSVEKPQYRADFNEAMMLLGLGDSAVFLIKADSFYLKTIRENKLPSFVKKGSDLTFYIRLVGLTPHQEYLKKQLAYVEQQNTLKDKLRKQESDTLKKYLEIHKISLNPTASGLYYIPEREGNGDKPASGKKVIVEYEGKFLNGKVFDSSRERGIPLEVKLGSHSVIKGFEEGILMMKKGGKARLIVPSYLGYAENTAGEIPPFTTLLFEVELLDIQ